MRGLSLGGDRRNRGYRSVPDSQPRGPRTLVVWTSEGERSGSELVQPSQPAGRRRLRRGTSRPRPWRHGTASTMRTSIGARLCSRLNPGPAGGATLVAAPRSARKDARRRWNIEVPFGASHLSSAGVPRHFEGIRRAFAVRAGRPGTRQLAVFVTVLGTGLHHRTCYRCSNTAAARSRSRRNRTPILRRMPPRGL